VPDPLCGAVSGTFPRTFSADAEIDGRVRLRSRRPFSGAPFAGFVPTPRSSGETHRASPDALTRGNSFHNLVVITPEAASPGGITALTPRVRVPPTSQVQQSQRPLFIPADPSSTPLCATQWQPSQTYLTLGFAMGRWHWMSGPPGQDRLTGFTVSISFMSPSSVFVHSLAITRFTVASTFQRSRIAFRIRALSLHTPAGVALVAALFASRLQLELRRS